MAKVGLVEMVTVGTARGRGNHEWGVDDLTYLAHHQQHLSFPFLDC